MVKKYDTNVEPKLYLQKQAYYGGSAYQSNEETQ